MAQVGRRRSILLTCMSIMSFLHDATGTQTWTVGDSFGWNRSPPLSYDQWAAGKAIQVGDALLFSFTAGQHNVLEVTESNLASCVAGNPISSNTGDPTIIQLTRNGSHGFISGLPGDCEEGMQLSLQVMSSLAQGATPTSSPVSGPPGTGGGPPLAGSSPPVGGPSKSGAPLSSSNPPATPPDSRQPLAGTPVGSPPPGYAPGAAPNISRNSPLSSAPNSLPAPMAIVPGSPLESPPSPAASPAGDVAAPSNPLSTPLNSPESSPSPVHNLIPPQSSPLLSQPRSIVGSPSGADASAATRRHKLNSVGLAVKMVATLIFYSFAPLINR